MEQLKIAIGYKMGAGKGTAANILRNIFGGKIFSFADPIYDIMQYAQNICEFPPEKDRKFLQFVGTEWGRSIDSDVWVDLLLRKARDFDGNCFIDDLRFPNEITALKRDGWKCIQISRDQVGNGTTLHASENALNDCEWDMVISNNGDIDQLQSKLIQAVTLFHLKTRETL